MELAQIRAAYRAVLLAVKEVARGYGVGVDARRLAARGIVAAGGLDQGAEQGYDLLRGHPQGRSPDGRPIELAAVSLDLREAVAAALGAARIIGVHLAAVGAVKLARELFTEDCHLVDRFVAEHVDGLIVQSAIAGEHDIRKLGAPASKAGIRRPGCSAVFEACRTPALARRDGEAAASRREEAIAELVRTGKPVPHVRGIVESVVRVSEGYIAEAIPLAGGTGSEAGAGGGHRIVGDGVHCERVC